MIQRIHYCDFGQLPYLYNVDSETFRWNSLPDSDASPPNNESGLTELFQEIRTTVDQEVRIVKAVFPNPAVVMQVFLQRVFAQSVR